MICNPLQTSADTLSLDINAFSPTLFLGSLLHVSAINQISRSQPPQTRRRLRRPVLQIDRAHCRREGHAVPGADAGRHSLVENRKGRSDGFDE